MKIQTILISYFLFTCLVFSAHSNADKLTLDFRIEESTESNETIVVFEKSTGKTIYFAKEPSITISDIKRAEYRSDDSSGVYTVTKSIYDEGVEFIDSATPIIDFYLNEEGKNKIANLTSRNVRKRLGIFINGKFITAPVISEKIDGGVFSLHAAGVIGVKEAKDLVNKINSSK
jgi:preprotein translocase subunit SecD